MRKLSLLLSALGGASAAYLLSNKKLRAELAKVQKPEDMGKVLGKHLQQDGKKLGKDICTLLESNAVQTKLKHAQGTLQKHFERAQEELQTFITTGTKEAKKQVKKAKITAKKRAKNAFKTKKV
ncbi:hypothetical protein COU77_03150 [Candidatus Peregrinibacteria bacterium CG10_big_fil_rev_8_21_14_0_10_49_16]|nr:MAG: hypothetical protein COW95_02665 [Candidatus Peregrinibacteria bacterium CG22_combo_CG10-13_8_21_14_all_49_11]PIR52031.1 MAG: hypothetical protein COU77_03150 [Candidatus Peregrinibacteria bacterium CG10_big_fil_rev_8_21_14_0_10_49_16]